MSPYPSPVNYPPGETVRPQLQSDSQAVLTLPQPSMGMWNMMLLRILMMMLRIALISSDMVTKRRAVSVMGFDNHNNRIIEREVFIPQRNSLDR